MIIGAFIPRISSRSPRPCLFPKFVEQLEKSHEYFLMTVRFGIIMYEANLKWCEEAKKTLSDISAAK